MIRKETLDGKTHLVVPTVMMIGDRYLPGSLGETWYSSELMALTASYWNGVPLVLNHPQRSGRFVSANSPDVLHQSKIGSVFNAQFDSGKLIGESWIDVERARLLDERVIIAISQNQAIDVSTGLFTDLAVNTDGKNVAVGCWIPDHLAVLVGGKGACDWNSGCGLNRT